MNILFALFSDVLTTSIMVGILILLLCLFKQFFPRLVSARVYNVLWLLILLRLLVPVSITTPLSLFNFLPSDSSPVSIIHPASFSLNGDASPDKLAANLVDTAGVQHLSSNTGTMNLAVACTGLWLLGLLTLAAIAAAATIRFNLKLKYCGKVSDPALQQLADRCSTTMKLGKPIPVFTHPEIYNPCIYGLFNPRILLPEDNLKEIGLVQLEHILLHEMAHYRRMDLFFNLAALAAAWLHWFNPLVWLALTQMRHDRELACDALVIESLGEKQAVAYGTTLLACSRLAGRRYSVNILGFHETNNQLENRIRMIKGFKRGSYRLSAISILCCLMVATVTMTGAASNQPSLMEPLAKMNNSSLSEEVKHQTVVINPGHGGQDLGVTYPASYNNPRLVEVMEKDLNYAIASKLCAKLRKAGVDARMTRQGDQWVSLEECNNIANKADADLFVSIHCEMSSDEKRQGTFTIYTTKQSAKTGITSQRLAELLRSELVKALDTKDLGSSPNDLLSIMKNTKMPAAYVGVAFISNQEDRAMITQNKYQDKAADALFKAIITALQENVAARQKHNSKSMLGTNQPVLALLTIP